MTLRAREHIGLTTGLTTGAVSRMVDRLVKAHLLTCTPDAHDRREFVTADPVPLMEVARDYSPLKDRLREGLSVFDENELRAMRDFARTAEVTTQELHRAAGPDLGVLSRDVGQPGDGW